MVHGDGRERMTWDMVLERKVDMVHGDGRERMTWDMVMGEKG